MLVGADVPCQIDTLIVVVRLGKTGSAGGRFRVVVVYYAAGVSFGATCMFMIIAVDVQVAGFLVRRLFLARNILRFRGLMAGC